MNSKYNEHNVQRYILTAREKNAVKAFNPLPHSKILDLSKLKAFADNIFILAQVTQYIFKWVENFVGKKRKCWLPAFSPFSTMFSKVSTECFLSCDLAHIVKVLQFTAASWKKGSSCYI